jgi:signal transduction histidine kinase/ligand-binding sensor domain-containing protein
LAYLLTCAAHLCAAVEGPTYRASREFLLDTWETEDGLPQISTVGITQTPDGFVWVGTFGGLARFDGVRFTVFNSDNTPAIRDNSVVRLLTDRKGTLWGAAPGTILSFANGRWRAYGQVDGWPGVLATALVEDGEGNLVAATETELLKLANGRFVNLPLPSLPTAWLRSSLASDGDGRLWIARGNYLGRFEEGQWRPVNLPTENTNVVVNGLAPARDGGLWVSTVKGLWKLGRESWTLARTLEFDINMPGPVALLEDSRGNVWAGDFARGLIIFTPDGRHLRCGREDGLENDRITTVFEDREDNVWAGTGGAGLTRFRPRAIVTHDDKEGLPSLIVNSVYEDVPGQILVGGTGLRRLAQGRFSSAIESGDAKFHRLAAVQTVWKDRVGAVWAGTYDGALFRVNGTAVTRVASSELRGQIRALYEDSAGAMWIGSGDAVIQHQAGTFTCYDTNAGVNVSRVCAIAEDSAGQLWVGGRDGLLRKEGARFEQIHPPWDTGMVLSLFRDSAGAMWVSFRKRSVSRWRNGKFELFGVEQGLPDAEIGSFVEDNERNLWLGTVGQGIVRITRESIEAVAAGQRRRLDCLRFGKSEGMRSAECLAGYQPSACRSSDGRLWFATVKGLVEVDPARAAPNSVPPPVWIQSVTYDAKGKLRSTNFDGAAIGELCLPAGVHRVQLRYTAPSFAAPQRVRFQHRLDGLDKNWIDGAAAREVTYSDFRPGRYIFHVRAANNDGVWNEVGANLALVAPPFFWQTIWFRFLALSGLAGGVGITAWRLTSNKLHRQIRQIQQERALEAERARLASALEQAREEFMRQLIASQEAERGRIAAELHDSLGQILLLVKNRAEIAGKLPSLDPKLGQQFEDISDLAAQSIAEVRRLSHDLRPYQLDQLGLTRALELMIESAAQSTEITFERRLDAVDEDFRADAATYLYRVVQEILNNILKHSQARHVRVVLERDVRCVRLWVEDDGRGFDVGGQAAASTGRNGFGLKNIAERVRILGGTLRLESDLEKGTRIEVTVPIPDME